MGAFGFESTTMDVIRGVSLAGKTAVVTGCTAGLGIETARTLLSAGADVCIVARNMEKLEPVAAMLQQEHPDARVTVARVDLSDLSTVRSGAAAILDQHPTINLLINNAGVMACPQMKTAQELEYQFGTNHVGHFLLTCLLVPALLNGAPARIVCLSSSAHRLADIDLDDPNFRTTPYDKWRAYGASKTANALFALELDKRLKDRGIRSFSVHPGVIMTELSRHLPEEETSSIRTRGYTFKTIAQGAATSIYAAVSDELNGQGGVYLENCHIAELNDSNKDGGVTSWAQDPDDARRLWTISEEIVGETFSW